MKKSIELTSKKLSVIFDEVSEDDFLYVKEEIEGLERQLDYGTIEVIVEEESFIVVPL